MTDWTNEEEEAFNEVEKHSNLGKQILKGIGQPYHFDVFVSVSQRNQVLEEAAKMCDDINAIYKWPENTAERVASQWCADAIRGMKK